MLVSTCLPAIAGPGFLLIASPGLLLIASPGLLLIASPGLLLIASSGLHLRPCCIAGHHPLFSVPEYGSVTEGWVLGSVASQQSSNLYIDKSAKPLLYCISLI